MCILADFFTTKNFRAVLIKEILEIVTFNQKMDVPLAKPLPLAIIKYILLDHDIICIYFLFLSSLTIKIGLNPIPWHCLCRVDLRPC
jgi:hypothetical protein